jgi:hypothetical protein
MAKTDNSILEKNELRAEMFFYQCLHYYNQVRFSDIFFVVAKTYKRHKSFLAKTDKFTMNV